MKLLFTLIIMLFISTQTFALSEIVTTNEEGNQSIIQTLPVDPIELEEALKVINMFTSEIDVQQKLPGWKIASSLLKSNTTEVKWEAMFKDLFNKLGKRLTAKFNRAFKTTKFPNAPEGDYIAIVLLTNFEKHLIAESITLEKENNELKLSGYSYQFIDIKDTLQ